MENKITKGKWRRSFVNGFTIMCDLDDGKTINVGRAFFTVEGEKDMPSLEQGLANAKLFEAAPLLLDSLLKLTSNEHIEQEQYDYFIKQAKERINSLVGN